MLILHLLEHGPEQRPDLHLQCRRDTQDRDYEQGQRHVDRTEQYNRANEREGCAADPREHERQQPPDQFNVALHPRDQVARRVTLVKVLIEGQQVVEKNVAYVEIHSDGEIPAQEALPVKGND